MLLIGIGYAILQANLQINGTTKISSNTWNVHFQNIQVDAGSVSIGTGDSSAAIDTENNCKVDFSVTLNVPGDYYEFTVDVINEGNIDAMIGSLNKTIKVNNVVVDSVPDYLKYDITYSDGEEILNNHLLEKNNIETYKVRVEFRSDIDELPDTASISVSLEPIYVQANENAVAVRNYAYYNSSTTYGIGDSLPSQATATPVSSYAFIRFAYNSNNIITSSSLGLCTESDSCYLYPGESNYQRNIELLQSSHFGSNQCSLTETSFSCGQSNSRNRAIVYADGYLYLVKNCLKCTLTASSKGSCGRIHNSACG